MQAISTVDPTRIAFAVNNSLGFLAIFRGALDVRARTISDEMALAAAHELASATEETGLSEKYIVPRMDEWQIYPRVAVATAMQAQEQDITRLRKSRDDLEREATQTIRGARDSVHALMEANLIPPPTAEAYSVSSATYSTPTA